jgi:hypothetical protein
MAEVLCPWVPYQGATGGGAGSRKWVTHNAATKPSRIKPIMSYLSKRATPHYDIGNAG